jgi:hypothetical protein
MVNTCEGFVWHLTVNSRYKTLYKRRDTFALALTMTTRVLRFTTNAYRPLVSRLLHLKLNFLQKFKHFLFLAQSFKSSSLS